MTKWGPEEKGTHFQKQYRAPDSSDSKGTLNMRTPPLPPIMTRLPQSNREGNKNKKLQKGEVHVALT